MSYKAGIVKAITELKDRTGSSSISIKKHMQVKDIFASYFFILSPLSPSFVDFVNTCSLISITKN